MRPSLFENAPSLKAIFISQLTYPSSCACHFHLGALWFRTNIANAINQLYPFLRPLRDRINQRFTNNTIFTAVGSYFQAIFRNIIATLGLHSEGNSDLNEHYDLLRHSGAEY